MVRDGLRVACAALDGRFSLRANSSVQTLTLSTDIRTIAQASRYFAQLLREPSWVRM